MVVSKEERYAAGVAAENVSGIKTVQSHRDDRYFARDILGGVRQHLTRDRANRRQYRSYIPAGHVVGFEDAKEHSVMQKVLIAIDLDHIEATEKLFREAKRLADSAGAHFVLLHVREQVPNYVSPRIPNSLIEMRDQEAVDQLSALANEHGVGDRSEALVRRGPPYDEIVACARERSVDLILIASHQPSRADILLGSVAASVVRHAHCSVLVLR